MTDASDPRGPIRRLLALVLGNLDPPPGRGRILFALAIGGLCHLVFAAAILAMVVALWNGMQTGIGAVPWPWAALVNALLVLQFPVIHSVLLNTGAGAWVGRVIPGPWGRTLWTTVYTILSSLQLLALFVLWTPSGVIWWQAEGGMLWGMAVLHACAWAFLMRSNLDAGVELQSGALGWMSLLQKRDPRWPGMAVTGLFTLIRQPIYVGFSLVLWTVPTWTPDQLAVAVTLTTYNVIAPGRFKERRYRARFGDRFRDYQARVPYMIPGTRRKLDG